MDPRPCLVTDDAGTWPGWVLAWQRSGDSWRGLCRYAAPVDGYTLTRERWIDSTSLRPR